MKTAVSLARLSTHRARQSGFYAQAHARLCRENPAVVIEDLNVKGMPANERLARSILDVGGIFRPLMRRYVAQRYISTSEPHRYTSSSSWPSRCREASPNERCASSRFLLPEGSRPLRDAGGCRRLRRGNPVANAAVRDTAGAGLRVAGRATCNGDPGRRGARYECVA